jgi:anti-repressor protein
MEENKIKTFMNEKFGEVRTVTFENVVHFVGVDIAKALGYSNPQKAIRDHCKGVNETFIPSKGGTQKAKIIKKSDIYRLIVRSKLQDAEEFENWVFEEVLPQLELTGGYIPVVKEDSPELIMAKGLKIADETIKRKDEIIALKDKRIAELEPDAEIARKLMSRKGLLTLKQVADNIEIGRTTLCSLLREKKILSKQTGYNEPMGKYIKSPYFKTIAEENEKTKHISIVTLVTPKGLKFIYRLIKKNELLDEFDTKSLLEVSPNA